jgi:mRNA interferase HicA
MRQYMRTMTATETSRQKIVSRLKAEGWQEEHGGEHDKFKHPERKGRIIVPRHRTLSPGVARQIAKQAGWKS